MPTLTRVPSCCVQVLEDRVLDRVARGLKLRFKSADVEFEARFSGTVLAAFSKRAVGVSTKASCRVFGLVVCFLERSCAGDAITASSSQDLRPKTNVSLRQDPL